MPCFNISWVGLFLFLYFLGKTQIFFFLHLFINVFLTSFCVFITINLSFFFFLLFLGGGGGGGVGFLCNIVKVNIHSIVYP